MAANPEVLITLRLVVDGPSSPSAPTPAKSRDDEGVVIELRDEDDPWIPKLANAEAVSTEDGVGVMSPPKVPVTCANRPDLVPEDPVKADGLPGPKVIVVNVEVFLDDLVTEGPVGEFAEEFEAAVKAKKGLADAEPVLLEASVAVLS